MLYATRECSNNLDQMSFLLSDFVRNDVRILLSILRSQSLEEGHHIYLEMSLFIDSQDGRLYPPFP